jgi:hypothetical protein
LLLYFRFQVEDLVAGNDGTGDTYILCRCYHLSIFAGSVFVPPNKLDTFQTVELLLTIGTNWIVLLTVSVILVIYGIFHVICYRMDQKDKVDHVGITVMCDVGENSKHSFYIINVVTGSRISSGTTANVSMHLYGSNGRSLVSTCSRIILIR